LKPSRYHPVLVALHWFLALFIVAALVLGTLVLKQTPNSSPDKIEALRAHMLGGIAILGLMLARLAVRTASASPERATAGNVHLDRFAAFSHFALYALVIAMALTGLATALLAGLPSILFGDSGAPLPETFNVFPTRIIHGVIAKALIALICIHATAALYHHFVRRDGLLRRMSFGNRWPVQAAKAAAAAAPIGRFWVITPWFARLLLLAAAALFMLIAVKYLGDPVGRAAADEISLGSVMAISRLRIGFGAFPLALSLLLLGSLWSPKRVYSGLVLLTTTVAVVTVVRLIGIVLDGPADEALKLLRVEAILLVLSVSSLFLERARQRRLAA
jgi:cytochrome b561